MDLSIVIPAFNEEKWLPRTLETVAAGARTLAECGVTCQVIVCDNNSADGTARMARDAGVRVVFEPVNQIGRARNTGASVAQGTWLLFLDADSTPSVSLWQSLAASLQDESIIAGGTTLKSDGNFFLLGIAFRCWNLWSRISGDAAGAFLFCRRAAFEQLGGFSADLFAAEEVDLCRRLKKIGRPRDQRMRILHCHPLITSARKAELYRPSEIFRFMLRTVLGRGKTLMRRDDCAIWYDGRR